MYPNPNPPHSLKSGLLALNGLLCLGEKREEDIAARFGDDRGVAFWLLGEINRRLHQPKEAAKHFCSCLKFNPFLWTAYQALCEIGVWLGGGCGQGRGFSWLVSLALQAFTSHTKIFMGHMSMGHMNV